MRFDLKVIRNVKNGQGSVVLPRKIMTRLPERVSVDLPKSLLKFRDPFSKRGVN